MIYRFYISIIKPTRVYEFLNDKLKILISYVLLLSIFFLIYPVLYTQVNSNLNAKSFSDLVSSLSSQKIKGNFSNYELILDEVIYPKDVNEISVQIGGELKPSSVKAVLHLGKYGVTIDYAGFKESKTYKELNVSDFEFSFNAKESVVKFVKVIEKGFNFNIITFSTIFSYYLGETLLFLILVIFLSIISIYSNKHLLLPTKYRVKLCLYLSSIYPLGCLIADLLGLEFLKAVVVVYIFIITTFIFGRLKEIKKVDVS
ncbi:MAG: hypothetical protein LBV58_04430 [Acholeplasmatales bacterium]|jgi:hypothetical protein|nr:hypothetical protein [Acholeplasmatales bacterium]